MLDPVPLDTLKPILMQGHGLKTVTEHWQGHGLKTMTESPSPPVVGVKAHHPQGSLASVKAPPTYPPCLPIYAFHIGDHGRSAFG